MKTFNTPTSPPLSFTPTTQVTVSPSQVDYRTRQGSNVLLVRVMFTTQNPRIMAGLEHYTSEGFGFRPYSLFVDEILWYICDAASHAGVVLP